MATTELEPKAQEMETAKDGVPPCTTMCATEFKASTYDKKNFEGTWVAETDMCGKPVKNPGCCMDKAFVSGHCMCYTVVCFYCAGMPCLPDITWTCGENCWLSQQNTYIYGEGDVVYHQWLCCPFEKWVRADSPKVITPQTEP